MSFAAPLSRVFLLVGCVVSASCAAPPSDEDLDTALALPPAEGDEQLDAPRVDCADHPLAGTSVPLTGRAHAVAGTLTIVDGCTVALEDFRYDGGGVDVRAIVAASIDDLGADDTRHLLSEDLRRPGGYDGARLVFPLPVGVTVDDVSAFSVWCVPFGASFGDATF